MTKAALSGLVVLLLSGRAHAQNKYLCCDLAAGATSTACVAAEQPCPLKATYSVMISDLDVAAAQQSAVSAWVNPLALGSSFPDGTDGYMYWSTSTPRLGFCLVAPAPGDPMHVNQQDPIGCFDVTLNPGVSGEMANVVVPADPRWDGYELCYGATDAVNGCQNLNDSWDLSVSETPSSHSCCGPVEMFREHGSDATTWVFGIDQELPGVPPPVLVIQREADGGVLVPYFNPDLPDADVIVSGADAGCLTAFNETKTCGMLPVDGGAPSPGPVDSKSAAVSDPSPTAEAGGCSVSGGRPSSGLLLLVGAILWARSRRRLHG